MEKTIYAELNDFYSLINIIRVIKRRTVRWAGHVARVRTGELNTGFWWGNLKEGDRLEDPGIDGMGWRVMDWIDMPQRRDRWRALVNAVMNLRVP